MKASVVSQTLLAAVIALIPTFSQADDAAAYQRAVDSVVQVRCTTPNGDVYRGTGVVVMMSELTVGGRVIRGARVVTAEHVLSAGGKVEVILPVRDDRGDVIGNPEFYAGRGLPCQVSGVNHDRDLALLRVFMPYRVEPIRMVRPGASPGQQIFTIGAGSGVLFHYAGGTIRQVYQGAYTTKEGRIVKVRLIDMTTPINPGDSGGPVLNQAAELVGINLASEVTSNQVHKGVDVSEVRAFVDAAILAEARALIKENSNR